jgi:polysaccharide pyruvyl transferase WcaK-like protein
MPTDNPRARHRPVIGVGLVNYTGQCGSQEHKGEDVYRDYLNKTGIFIKWLLTNNYGVRLLIGDVTYDTPVKNDLLRLLSQGEAKCEDGQIIDEPIVNVEDLLLQLAQTDIVVSARFHNIVLSLILGKPAIALSYTDKFDSLMENFGMMEYCHRLETFDVDRLIKQFLKLEKNAESITAIIQSKTEQCRAALDEQYVSLFKDFRRN